MFHLELIIHTCAYLSQKDYVSNKKTYKQILMKLQNTNLNKTLKRSNF